MIHRIPNFIRLWMSKKGGLSDIWCRERRQAKVEEARHEPQLFAWTWWLRIGNPKHKRAWYSLTLGTRLDVERKAPWWKDAREFWWWSGSKGNIRMPDKEGWVVGLCVLLVLMAKPRATDLGRSTAMIGVRGNKKQEERYTWPRRPWRTRAPVSEPASWN